MNISDYLTQQIRDGKVVLFLGAGASIGSLHKGVPASDSEKTMPAADQLIELLSTRFLGGSEKDRPLHIVAEYATDESDLLTVQSFIKEKLGNYKPADFHKRIPNFKWAAIVTTNYDLIIEDAYYENESRLQNLKPITKTTDRIEALTQEQDSLIYLKLHGCISKYDDLTIPLILTIDQYQSHQKNRIRLFERFQSYASDFPVIYVGYRLEDPDLRKIDLEITAQGISRPRSYVVTPNPNPRDVRLWQQKKIETLDGTFEDFLSALEEKIPSALRKISLAENNHPIERRFVSHKHLSPVGLSFLKYDALLVNQDILDSVPNDPKRFYRGYSGDWSFIDQNLDAHRLVTDNILSEYFLRDEIDESIATELLVIKGYAGAGKSVILKRVAWNATFDLEKICIYLKNDGHIKFEALKEICELTNERIYLFIDKPSLKVNEIENLIINGRKNKLKLTLVCAERSNEWNIDCGKLATLVDDTFEVKGLSIKEINSLLDKLNTNSALGVLNGLPREAQIKTFSEYANRQLLVALYEVTNGKSFEEIIFDEYENIFPQEAQKMYLIICSLNRLDVPVRAGIINRLTNISFTDFKEKFFGPLESIVLTEEYKPALDNVYRTRHSWIAETVFEKALPDQNERFDLYIDLINVLDTGYQPDRVAFREIIKARNLMADFSDYTRIFNIYKIANDRFSDDAYLLQQQGIFEMKRANPNLENAYGFLIQAKNLAPYDKSIYHSLSELEIQRANKSSTLLEKEKHLRQAKSIAQEIISDDPTSSYAYVTVVKVGIEKLSELIKIGNNIDSNFTDLIKEIEKHLQDGFQRFPDDTYLIAEEAELFQLIERQDKALAALEKANKANPASPFIARNLSRICIDQNKVEKAKDILTKCLDTNPSEKYINAALAQLLTTYYPEDNQKAELHWRRAFTEGDTNYYSQFWYARQLFINNKPQEAEKLFKSLKLARVSHTVKLEVRGVIQDENKKPKVFSGEISSKSLEFIWIKVRNESFFAYSHKTKFEESYWQSNGIGSKLKFTLGFNYYGLCIDKLLA